MSVKATVYSEVNDMNKAQDLTDSQSLSKT